MKKTSIYLLLCFLCVWPSLAQADGYYSTVVWWQKARSQADQYSPFLQNLYTQTEAGVHDKKTVNQIFCQTLRQRYPGSDCLPMQNGVSGVLAINGIYYLGFSSNWTISSLKQKTGNLTTISYFNVGQYDPRRNSFEVFDGTNNIVFQVNETAPWKSRFTTATLPSVANTALSVSTLRQPPFNNQTNVLSGVLNDLYAYKLAQHTNLRMDEFAQRLVEEPVFRNWALHQAQALYQEGGLNKLAGEAPNDLGEVVGKGIAEGLASVGKGVSQGIAEGFAIAGKALVEPTEKISPKQKGAESTYQRQPTTNNRPASENLFSPLLNMLTFVFLFLILGFVILGVKIIRNNRFLKIILFFFKTEPEFFK